MDKAVYASNHGFVVENNLMVTPKAQIESNWRKTYTKRLSSPETIRPFRDRITCLTFRVAQNVLSDRLKAETKSHIYHSEADFDASLKRAP